VFGQSIVYTLNVINHGPGEFVSEVPFYFTNPDRIDIPFIGLADPYPSATVPISGLSGKIAHVSVTLEDIFHAKSSDVDVLLVGPNGQGVILMSGAGTGVFGENLTFDDNASLNLPSDAAITTGIYKPTDYNMAHLFPPPAPLGSYADNLAVFNGLDPNGTWKLFALDNGLLVGGEIDDGWTLNLTLERQVTVHDKLPEMIHLSTIQPGIWDCEAAMGDVLCTSDILPSSSQINLDVTVEFTTGLEILNTATVQTESYDPDLTNNTSEVVIYQWKWWLPFIMK
jgi:subtilisin-like proprotein convertase family protein